MTASILLQKFVVDTAYQRLQDLKESEYPQWLKDLGLILMCGFYAALFGATPIELVIASVAAVIMPFIYKLDPKLKLGTFVLNLLSIIPAIVIIIMIQKHFVPDARIGISIVGLIMPAVPGTAITNAIRDTLRGDYNSGAARAIEAFVTALSVAIAVALGLVLAGGANPL